MQKAFLFLIFLIFPFFIFSSCEKAPEKSLSAPSLPFCDFAPERDAFPYLYTQFKTLYEPNKSFFGFVFDASPTEKSVSIYKSIGLSGIITLPNGINDFKGNKDGFSFFVTLENLENTAFYAESELNSGIFFNFSLPRETADFLAAKYPHKTFFYLEEDEIFAVKGESFFSFYRANSEKTENCEKVLECYAETLSENSNGIIFYDNLRILSNENAVSDAVSSVFAPALRKNMTDLTVGIPSSRNFETKYSVVYLTGGSNPNFPLTAGGNKVLRTANGLFTAKIELNYGENTVVLQNGENELTFKITRLGAKTTEKNKASEKPSEIGKTAVINGTGYPLLFEKIPVTSNENSKYAPDGLKDVIVDKIVTQNKINDTEIEVFLLASGYYVQTEYVTVTETEELPPPSLSLQDSFIEDTFFVLKFSAEGNPFFTVSQKENGAEIVLKNTELKDGFAISENPLFEGFEIKKESVNTSITLKCFEKTDFSGWYAYFENDSVIIKFRIPKKANSGDKPLSNIKIMLDAGHSVNVGGSQGPDCPFDFKERDLNYLVALKTKHYLESLGAEVVISRNEKTTETLYASVVKTWYQRENADIGISIHFNAVSEAANPLGRSGILTIFANEHSRRLSDTVSENVSKYSHWPLKASSKSDYIICHTPFLPSIIIECGYMTNICEYDKFLKEENIDVVARSLARSVFDYFSA